MKLTLVVTKLTIEPVVLLYVFAIFAEYAVVEDLFYVSKCFNYLQLNDTELLHNCTTELKNKNGNSINPEASDIISKQTNNALLIYNGILYSTSIVSSFIAASYADRATKFIPIFVPILGSAAVQVLVLCSLLFTTTTGEPLVFSSSGSYIIFACSFVSGITGGTSTLLSSCFAYVAEKCTQSQRTSRITIIEACLFGGGFAGFTYAGSILRNHPNSLSRYYYNFGIFFVVHLLLGFYVLIRSRMFDKSHLNDNAVQSSSNCGSLFTSVLRTVFHKRNQKGQRFIILLILVAFTIISYWNVALTTLLFIYTRHRPLGWESWKYSYFSSAKFALCGISLCLLPCCQYLLTQKLFFRPLSDNTIIVVGLLSRGLSILLIGLATSTPLMIAGLVVICFAEFPIPAIRSLVSKIIEPNEKAQIFVFMATIQSICFFTGGMFFLAIYNVIIDRLASNSEMIGPFNGPGLIFIVVGLAQFVTIGILIYANRVIRRNNWIKLSQNEMVTTFADNLSEN